MKRIICLIAITCFCFGSCGPKSIPETRSGRKKAERIHKKQYEMHPSYKKKR